VFLCFEHVALARQALKFDLWMDSYHLVINRAYHDLLIDNFVSIRRVEWAEHMSRCEGMADDMTSQMQQTMEMSKSLADAMEFQMQQTMEMSVSQVMHQSKQRNDLVWFFVMEENHRFMLQGMALSMCVEVAGAMLSSLTMLQQDQLGGFQSEARIQRQQFVEMSKSQDMVKLEENHRFMIEKVALGLSFDFFGSMVQSWMALEKKSEQQNAFVGMIDREEFQRSKLQCVAFEGFSVVADSRASCLAKLQEQQLNALKILSEQQNGFVCINDREELQRSKLQCMAFDKLSVMADFRASCLAKLQGQQLNVLQFEVKMLRQQIGGTGHMNMAQDMLKPDQHCAQHCELEGIVTSERIQRLMVENEALSIHMELVELMVSSVTTLLQKQLNALKDKVVLYKSRLGGLLSWMAEVWSKA